MAGGVRAFPSRKTGRRGRRPKPCLPRAIGFGGFPAFFAAMAEALVFCQRSGVDPAVMLEAIAFGAAGSWQITNLGPKVVQRDFSPGFKVGLQQKDLRLALEAADSLDLPLAGTSLVHQLFRAVEHRDGGDIGTQALVRALEALADVEVKSERVPEL